MEITRRIKKNYIRKLEWTEVSDKRHTTLTTRPRRQRKPAFYVALYTLQSVGDTTHTLGMRQIR